MNASAIRHCVEAVNVRILMAVLNVFVVMVVQAYSLIRIKTGISQGLYFKGKELIENGKACGGT
jgi:hypothetical protein